MASADVSRNLQDAKNRCWRAVKLVHASPLAYLNLSREAFDCPATTRTVQAAMHTQNDSPDGPDLEGRGPTK